MYNNMFNPYPNYQPTFQQNYLPKQEILKVNGKQSVNNIQLAPNSSVLAMDTTAPLVWLCISDGTGTVTATPYTISEYQEAPPIDYSTIENRLTEIEKKVEEMSNAKPDFKNVKSNTNSK